MTVIWQWLTGGWRFFRPGFCCDCRKWNLVFRKGMPDDAGRCEQCWLDLK